MQALPTSYIATKYKFGKYQRKKKMCSSIRLVVSAFIRSMRLTSIARTQIIYKSEKYTRFTIYLWIKHCSGALQNLIIYVYDFIVQFLAVFTSSWRQDRSFLLHRLFHGRLQTEALRSLSLTCYVLQPLSFLLLSISMCMT